MSSAATTIPYEEQSEQLTGRACGAACLSMAYRSLGKPVRANRNLARDRQSKSLRAGLFDHLSDGSGRSEARFQRRRFQARHPLQALRLAKAAGIRVILTIVYEPIRRPVNYSVLVDIDEKEVVLHDPLFGAARRLAHAELIELWLPQVPELGDRWRRADRDRRAGTAHAAGLRILPHTEVSERRLPALQQAR